MRKFKMHLHVSLDGLASDGEWGLRCFAYSDRISAHARSLTEGTDAVVFGPRTYKGMASHWPTIPADPTATEGERAHATWVNAATKLLVSTTAAESDATWEKTVLVRHAEDLAAIKQQPGRDIISFGSPRLVANCLALGLVDELHLFLNPIIIGGGGASPFATLPQTRLELLSTTPLDQGVLALVYAVKATS